MMMRPPILAAAQLTGFDMVNVFSAVTSIVLAIVALFLAIFFFVQSKKDAQRSEASAAEISSSVSRLEKIFDSLYSDTFGIMRDTVTDMRKHVWTVVPTSSDNGSSDAEEKAAALTEEQKELMAKIAEVSRQVGIADNKVSELQSQLGPMVNKTLTEASKREDRYRERESLAIRLKELLELTGSPMTLQEIATAFDAPISRIVPTVFKLAKEGVIVWNGHPNELSDTSKIWSVTPQESHMWLEGKLKVGKSSSPGTQVWTPVGGTGARLKGGA